LLNSNFTLKRFKSLISIARLLDKFDLVLSVPSVLNQSLVSLFSLATKLTFVPTLFAILFKVFTQVASNLVQNHHLKLELLSILEMLELSQ